MDIKKRTSFSLALMIALNDTDKYFTLYHSLLDKLPMNMFGGGTTAAALETENKKPSVCHNSIVPQLQTA